MSRAMATSAEAGELLSSRGLLVTPATLNELMAEAVASLQRTLYPVDPRTELPAHEVEILEEGGFAVKPARQGKRDPLARTAAEFAALLEHSLSTTEAAGRLRVDPSRIRQRLTAVPPTLYGIRVGSGWVIPELQFDRNRLIPGLGEVVSRLDPELHPVAVLRWFMTPNPDLTAGAQALSPRQWLLGGHAVETVCDLAENL